MNRQKYTTALNAELIRRLKMQAVIEGTRPNEIIEKALTAYLETAPKA